MRGGRYLWLLFWLVLIGWGSPRQAHAQSLADLFYSALESDPSRASAAAELKASEERMKQARGQLLPTVNLVGSASYSRFDNAGENAYREFQNERIGIQSQLGLYRPALNLGYDESILQQDAAQSGLDAAETELLDRLISAFFEVLSAREVSVATSKEKAATMQQLSVAKRSFEIGTAAITDVRDAEAKHDLAIAKAASAESDLASKRDSLQELVAIENLQLRILPPEGSPPNLPLPALRALTVDAITSDAAVRECRLRLNAAEVAVKKTKVGHLPTLDLSFNYGPEYSTGTSPNPVRTHGRTSQVEANLSVPIFAGFSTSAKVREAQAVEEKTRAECVAAERRVSAAVREAHYGLASALAQAAALSTATKSSDASVRANRKGYKVGVNTNAEVLDAESQAIQAQRDFMKAKLDAWMNYLKLCIRAGGAWRATLSEVDRLLVIESQDARDLTPVVDSEPKKSPRLPASAGRISQDSRAIHLKLDPRFASIGIPKSEDVHLADNDSH